jgi:RNA polymerase sigma-70 factor (ECF subfamily)
MVREQVDAVYSCLESLPAAVRTTLVLHRFENMTYSEIATRLGVSVSSVEKYMMRALREIALVYEEAP